jgi:cobalt-zinc-cadmium efflux system protein
MVVWKHRDRNPLSIFSLFRKGMVMHEHAHHDAHGRHHHSRSRATRFRLLIALLATFGFVIFEAFAGFESRSLALLSDAAHNLTDVVALGISWYALHLADRPAQKGRTFGYHRGGILAALFNAATLLIVAVGITGEAWTRISHPVPIAWETLAGVGTLALGVNGMSAWLVGHGSHDDLNLRSAFLHLLGDVMSNVGAILAGIGIGWTGFLWLDPAASILIALLIIWNAWVIVRETLDILMERAPRDLVVEDVGRDLSAHPAVTGIHDLHVWSLSRRLRFLSVHIEVCDMPVSATEEIRAELAALVRERFQIGHATFQFESDPSCHRALYCDLNEEPDGCCTHHH